MNYHSVNIPYELDIGRSIIVDQLSKQLAPNDMGDGETYIRKIIKDIPKLNKWHGRGLKPPDHQEEAYEDNEEELFLRV